MKTTLKRLAIMALMPVAVMAQANLDAEVNAELDKMYKEQSQKAGANAAQASQANNAPQVQVNVQAQPTVTTSQNATQGAAQTATQEAAIAQIQEQVVKQPTTVIEAAPLTESNAERLRKARQDAELATEATIVEKLEQSRLEDEKRRSEILFGDRFNTIVNGNNNTVVQQQQEQAVVAPAAPAVVAAEQTAVVATPVVVAPVVEEKKEELSKDAIRGEVNAALAELKAQEEKPKSSTYFGAILGVGEYPDAVNVKPQYAIGLSFGKKFDDRLVVEGAFVYSNYQVEQRDGGCVVDMYGYTECYPRITSMDQYSGQGLVKYQVLGGTIRPEIGAVAAYTYRTFSDTQFAISDAEASSHALDLGLMTGASVELTEKFSLGLDFRYMWNLTNRVNSGFQKSYVEPYLKTDTPIEKMSYYTLSVMGRASF